MLKRFVPLVAVVSVLVSLFAIPTFAAETVQREILDYRDFASKSETADGRDYVAVSIPAKYCSVYLKTLDGSSSVCNGVTGTVDFSYRDDCYASFKFCFPGCLYSDPLYYMSLDNIKDGTPLHLISKFFVNPSFNGNYNVRVFYQVNYYNESFANIAVLPTKPNQVSFNNCSGRFDGQYETDESADNAFKAPVGAKYFAVSLVVRVEDIALSETVEAGSDDLSIDFGFSDWSLDLMQDELLPVESSDFLSSIGTFFSSSMGWLSDIFSLVVSNAPLLVLTVGIICCGFVLVLVSRIKG